jgi:hypothetical protein
MRVLIPFLMLALAACGQTTAPSEAPAPTTQVADDDTSLSDGEVHGPFEATSNTAMSITGDMSFSDANISFMNGIVLHTTPIGAHAAFDEISANGDTYDSVAPGDDNRIVDLRQVQSQELIDPPGEGGAPNTGVCDPAPTYVAIVHDPAFTTVSIIGFSGSVAPGPTAPADAVCATYLYMGDAVP